MQTALSGARKTCGGPGTTQLETGPAHDPQICLPLSRHLLPTATSSQQPSPSLDWPSSCERVAVTWKEQGSERSRRSLWRCSNWHLSETPLFRDRLRSRLPTQGSGGGLQNGTVAAEGAQRQTNGTWRWSSTNRQSTNSSGIQPLSHWNASSQSEGGDVRKLIAGMRTSVAHSNSAGVGTLPVMGKGLSGSFCSAVQYPS
jgi:hypothetical protein